MSTGLWWHGRCGSINAFQVTGHGRAFSSNPSRGKPRVSSRTGGKVLSARSPDGSCVRRESHAQFYERPEVQFLRPTHHKLHYVRDVTCREDQARTNAGHAPQVLAASRNVTLTLLRRLRFKPVEGFEHFAEHRRAAIDTVSGKRTE